MKKQVFRKKSDHTVVVEKIGEGYERKGEAIKFPAVFYVDRKGELASRPTAEFDLKFEPVR